MKARLCYLSGELRDVDLDQPLPKRMSVPHAGDARLKWDKKLERGVGHEAPAFVPPEFPRTRFRFAGIRYGVALYYEEKQ